jgi:hypothetical protein
MHTLRKYSARVLLVVLIVNSCSSVHAIDASSLLESARKKMDNVGTVLKKHEHLWLDGCLAIAAVSLMVFAWGWMICDMMHPVNQNGLSPEQREQTRKLTEGLQERRKIDGDNYRTVHERLLAL